MTKKQKPAKTFSNISDFLKFCLDGNKRYASDDLGTTRMDGTIKFLDGSYAECDYDPDWNSENGTWYPGHLDILYYEPDQLAEE